MAKRGGRWGECEVGGETEVGGFGLGADLMMWGGVGSRCESGQAGGGGVLAMMAVGFQEVGRCRESLEGPDCKWMVHEIG